ncbi:MAG: glycosyltransferase family 2 protein [Anaerolineae bacterium]|nr:glycosyltransferase family 2 protein [Thermoflexales bacterium]MDW8407490.1 glycosyltransferase family 2 protein [Anaerolineae bacterium]
MTLGIVILNWNQAEDTIACVHEAQSWPISDKHIWVVDNCSQPADRRRLTEALAGVELILSQKNLGFAGGNNLALRRALHIHCEWVLLLNNDARAQADAVQQLRRTLERHPSIGIVGPVLVDAAHPTRLLSAGGRDIARHVSSHIVDPLAPGALRRVDYVPGTCVMIRAEVLRTVGLLDEEYFFGGEVADLCARAKLHGWLSAIDGSAVVQHAVDRSAAIRRQLHIYYVMRNRFLYVRKFYPRARLSLSALWTMYGMYAGGWAIARRQFQQARAIALGCIDGWCGRFGGQNARVTRGEIS